MISDWGPLPRQTRIKRAGTGRPYHIHYRALVDAEYTDARRSLDADTHGLWRTLVHQSRNSFMPMQIPAYIGSLA
jgi:hypothetical protein